jgi:hypothetical protein
MRIHHKIHKMTKDTEERNPFASLSFCEFCGESLHFLPEGAAARTSSGSLTAGFFIS